MKTTGNTILITGGSAGIGFEIAKHFSENDNHVIITGRNEERLKQAVAKLQNVTGIVSDVTLDRDVNLLEERIKADFPELNILINNAGLAFKYDLTKGSNFERASSEMFTNFLSVVNLTERLLPVLSAQPESAIVNVSSIVAFAPALDIPTYSASKAALHAYTKTLRLALEETPVKVFDLMPPLVNTAFSEEIGGINGIPPSLVAEALLHAFEKNIYEIHVEGTEDLYQLFRSSPEHAFAAINGVEVH